MDVRGARLYLRWRALEHNDRIVAAAIGSAIIGMATAMGKIAVGIWAMSPLFLLTGVYYAVLGVARCMVGLSHGRIRTIEEPDERRARSWRVRRRAGVFLLLTGLSYSASCVMMLFDAKPQRVNLVVAITVATITSVKVGGAICGLIAACRMRDPIDSSVRFLSLADASFALVTTQNVMLLAEGSSHATLSSALLGIVMGLAVTAMGVWMRKPVESVERKRADS